MEQMTKRITHLRQWFFFLKGGLWNEHLKFYLLFCVTTKTALFLEGIFMCVGSRWKDKVK